MNSSNKVEGSNKTEWVSVIVAMQCAKSMGRCRCLRWMLDVARILAPVRSGCVDEFAEARVYKRARTKPPLHRGT